MVWVGRDLLSKQRVGTALVVSGMILLLAVGIYYSYAAIARSDLNGLNYEIETPFVGNVDGLNWQFDEGATIGKDVNMPELIKSDADRTETYGDTSYRDEGERPVLTDSFDGKPDSELNLLPDATSGPFPEVSKQVVTSETDFPSSSEATETDSTISFDSSAFASYLPTQIDPRYWDNPIWAAPPDARVEASKTEAASYSELSSSNLAVDTSHATRMRISAIDVDSDVKDLEIIDLGDSRAWETPNKIVGHIPITATRGERGQGWYFGHLESPIRGEGNVFQKLPEIPCLLREGEDVYIFIETSERKYAYKVYKTEVIPQEELQLTDSGEQESTLVACVPTLVYDHRILVTAALVGVQDL